MEGQIEFCQEGMRCRQCPFLLFHDETARQAVDITVKAVINDDRLVSNTNISRIIKARLALQGLGIARPDSRQVNATASAAQRIAVDGSCSSYDLNGVRT